VFYRSSDGTIAPWECRLCELDDDKVVVLFWAYDTARQLNLDNHMVVSNDGGNSFAPAIATGIRGQASNLMALGSNRVLSIHCHREDPVSLTVRTLVLNDNSVTVESESALFETGSMASKTDDIAQQFGSLKFGQPSLLRLSDTNVIAACWRVEKGQHVITGYRLTLD